MTNAKAGKAHKAAKARQAAKHRARHQHTRELRRKRTRSSTSARATLDLGAPSEKAAAVFQFCKEHNLDPLKVLETLLVEPEEGTEAASESYRRSLEPATWKIEVPGSDACSVVDDEAVRDELIRRFSAVLYGVLPKAKPAVQVVPPDDVLPCL
jgi:hypothetical protein